MFFFRYYMNIDIPVRFNFNWAINEITYVF